jgi:hypothetical protein
MNRCKYIKERIDEAEKPTLLSFDVTEHIGECQDCAQFAAERASLRSLLSTGTRVNAPVSFDAMLNARLAEVKSRPAFWWLGSLGYARLVAAAAGIVVMIFAAQFSGLFSAKPVAPVDESPMASATVKAPEAKPQVPKIGSQDIAGTRPTPVAHETRVYLAVSKTRRAPTAAPGSVPIGYFTAEDGGVVLVRGRNGDMDVQVPTVSVGAQPLLYVSAGQRTVRNVGSSF